MVVQKGRAMIMGIEKGMAALDDSSIAYDYQGNDLETLTTEQDSAAVHTLCTKNVNINNPVHCFKLECDLS